MIKLEKVDYIAIAVIVAMTAAANLFSGASTLRHLTTTIIMIIISVVLFSYVNHEQDDVRELGTDSKDGNINFYQYFIETDCRTAAFLGLLTPVAVYRLTFASGLVEAFLMVAGLAICVASLWYEHRRIVSFDEAPFLKAWYRAVGTMLGLSLLAAGCYFAIRYAQWNGYARLPERLAFGTRKQSEITLLLISFCVLLWWLAGVVSRAAVRGAADAFYGRAFGARARAGRDPYL